MKLGKVICKDNKKLSSHGFTKETILKEYKDIIIPVKPSKETFINLNKPESQVTITFNPRNHKEYKQLINLKGKELEKLNNNIVVECNSKSYVISGVKNNQYIMESVDNGSIKKYDIDDLKYDYKIGKVNIFESEEENEYENVGVEEGLPKGFIKNGRLYQFFNEKPLYFHFTGISEDNKYFKVTYDKEHTKRDTYIDSTIVTIDGLVDMFNRGELKIADIDSNYEKPDDNGDWDEEV